MFFKKTITAIKCDRCLNEIDPSFPQFPINERGEHFCLDCGFIKGLCTEEEFLDDVGGGLTKRAGFNANIIDDKIIIWSGIAPWETDPATIRRSKAYQDWRKSVLKRDKKKCTQCFSTTNLHAHHIKPFAKYKELRFEISNGITLCESCHIDAHKKMREAEKGNDRR